MIANNNLSSVIHINNLEEINKYTQLLQVIEEIGRDIKPTYANNRNASERLKKNIHTARVLVRECVSELEKALKAN